MYNMEISILGYKLNVEILILICIVYLILVVHTVYSCCNCGKIMEGLEAMATTLDPSGNIATDIKKAKASISAADLPAQQISGTNVKTSTTTPVVPTTVTPGKEGFAGANINYGESSVYDLSSDAQSSPLPEGDMLLFANTKFKPECCPNTYSTGSGCACMTGEQTNFLKIRGSNNVPYSEY